MRKILLCLLFEYSYFFFLAIVVPTVTVSVPPWLQEGAYAKYAHAGGFYSWEVVSINTDNGRTQCLINQTWVSFKSENDTGERRTSIVEIDPRRGGYWLSNYFNEHIPFGTCFIGDATYISAHIVDAPVILRFSSVGRMQVDNISSIYMEVYNHLPILYGASENFRFDIGSGLLLQRNHASARGMMSSEERIVSTNIPLTSSRNPAKTFFDLSQLAPLIGVPLVMYWRDASKYARVFVSGIKTHEAKPTADGE